MERETLQDTETRNIGVRGEKLPEKGRPFKQHVCNVERVQHP